MGVDGLVWWLIFDLFFGHASGSMDQQNIMQSRTEEQNRRAEEQNRRAEEQKSRRAEEQNRRAEQKSRRAEEQIVKKGERRGHS